jgi:hypothetical protein
MGAAQGSRLGYNRVFGGLVQGLFAKRWFLPRRIDALGRTRSILWRKNDFTSKRGSENLMIIKPLYLLADSQLFFWKSESDSLAERLRADLDTTNPNAAYVGASNGDQPEFYSLFQAAMESMEISNCRLVPSQPSKEDISFLENADLIVLSGGDVERGWRVFEQNGLKDLLPRKRFDGAVLMGVSAGAVQLGLGHLSNAAQPKPVDMFRFAPFYVGAHEEENDWWDLRALVNLSQADVRGIGIPAGGGAVYQSDGTLEPIRKHLTELTKESARITENVLAPLIG